MVPDQQELRYETVHATSIAIDGRAILLTGPSGSGKSDLALRLVDRGATLVSDDYTLCTARHGVLLAAPPDTIAGRMEVRGVGILPVPHMRDVPVALIIALGDNVPRMPDDLPPTLTVAGVSLPLAYLAPFEASAPIKAEYLLRAMSRSGA